MSRILTRYLVLLQLTIACGLSAQGYLMLAGGAAENQGGWSDIPYRWVVDHAANKRVAVISYNSGQSEWIPDYFKGFGAVEARNITIQDRVTADKQSLYDTLMGFDGIFIKGGDQSVYYDRFNGTKTGEAFQNIYEQGGVLSGTSAGTVILSPVIYTAQLASIDPSQALLNAYSSQITLADDFLNTVPGRYIYDSHFVERGRFGRLPAFMASWYRIRGEVATGIGIDDHTAFCIDSAQQGYIFGTGAVTLIYNMEPARPYDTTVNMLRAGNMMLTQLIHGCSIDLRQGTIAGLGNFIKPPVAEENAKQNVLTCGTDYPSNDALDYFVTRPGASENVILIVTGTDDQRAIEVKNNLESLGATGVQIIQAISENQNDPAVLDAISGAGKMMIINNEYQQLMNFISGGGNGSRLIERLEEAGMVSFFVGDNARFAGKTVVEKYRGFGYTSYHGTLEFMPGLGLLQTTVIMPYTFISSDDYENTVSGLPYAMIRDSLAYGIYLTGNTLAEYGYEVDGKSYVRNVSGSYPVIFLENRGTYTGLANQGPYASSRNIAGFESMNLKYLGKSDSVRVGNSVPVSFQAEFKPHSFRAYPNPAKDFLTIQGARGTNEVRIIDMAGRVLKEEIYKETLQMDLSGFPEGMYLIYNLALHANQNSVSIIAIQRNRD